MSNIDDSRLNNEQEPEMAVNEHDGAVAIDEKDRTVLLTENETIIVHKEPEYDIAPANRPRKVYGGMWGNTEIGIVGAASLAVVAALVAWFFFTLPAQRELAQNRSTRDRLESELNSARAKYGDITNTQDQVAKLVSSVDDFESNYLPVASNGRTALYQKLNGLIVAHGLVNTTGPDYAALEIADKGSNNQSEDERGRSRFRSLFPGTYVTMTLEGPYANLRRFIREVETGSDFVIISGVELEPSERQQERRQQQEDGNPDPIAQAQQQNLPPGFGGIPVGPSRSAAQQQPGMRRPAGRTIGEVVSLRLEMAAYFRRAAVQVPTDIPAQQ